MFNYGCHFTAPSTLACLPRVRNFFLSPITSKPLLRRLGMIRNDSEAQNTNVFRLPGFATCNLVPRVFSLSNMAAAGDPGTQQTKTIADWCIPLRVHTCALIGLFLPKQRWLPFEGFVEAEKCFLQCLRPKRWTEFRSDCSENCDCTVGRKRFEYSDI